jgi:hypothetical protein
MKRLAVVGPASRGPSGGAVGGPDCEVSSSYYGEGDRALVVDWFWDG